MTITQDDMLNRQKAVIPPGWFPSDTPVLDGLLSGFAAVAKHLYDLIEYSRLQTRIGSASDGFLDLIAFDFFGQRIRRRPGQTDESMRAMILKEVLRIRGTRKGLENAIKDLTGTPVSTVELFDPRDCGGYDTGYLGYDTAGLWGSVTNPRQILLNAQQPAGAGLPGAPGLDDGLGGYDTPPEQWGDQSMVVGPVTTQDIYDTINATRAAGVTVWTKIGDA